ncbi:hypothetical protein MHK11_09185, partial [Corynebacterium aurimucosum]|nr:hypothetical protein [Corynebacterium aurimucosum]
NPTKEQTTTNHKSLCWRPKITTKKKYSPLNPTGSKRGNQKVEHNHMPTNPSQCSRNTKQHSKKVRVPHTQPAHTNQQTTKPAGRQTNQHTTMHTKNKKYIGTLLSSQTSSPHNNHTLWSAAHCEQKEFCFVRACFPIAASARNFSVPVGRCRSR